MAHEISPPSTAEQAQIFFTNDAQTLLEVVCPGNPLPVTGSLVVTPVTSATLTTTQVTVPASANGILVLASNASRKGATICNTSAVTIYISSAATGLTTSNGFAIPAGSSYNIDEPLYTGAVYGIVASGTQTAFVVELT